MVKQEDAPQTFSLKSSWPRLNWSSLSDSVLAWVATLLAGCCVLAIAVVSLLPADEMLRTGIGGHTEHVVAYTLTTLAVAHSRRHGRLALVSGALIAYAAALEFLQRFVPGRSSELIDLLFSIAGVATGASIIVLLMLLMRLRVAT